MVISKALFATLLFSMLFLIIVQSDPVMKTLVEDDTSSSPPSQARNIDCGSACNRRCKLSSRPNLCKRACGTCCQRCNCVPSGTYGHYEECPCYANMTTHGGRRKCP